MIQGTQAVTTPKDKFIWDISSVASSHTIFNDYKIGQYISSAIFHWKVHKLFIKLYPNQLNRNRQQICSVQVIYVPNANTHGIFNQIEVAFLENDTGNIVAERKIQRFNGNNRNITAEFDVDTLRNCSFFKLSVKIDPLSYSHNDINYTLMEVTNSRVDTYNWKITDTSKRAKYTQNNRSRDKSKNQIYVSPVFKMHSFKWYLYITESKDLYIHCIDRFRSNIDEISSVSFVAEIQIGLENAKFMIPLSFGERTCTLQKLDFGDFKIEYDKYPSLSIEIRFILIDVFGPNLETDKSSQPKNHFPFNHDPYQQTKYKVLTDICLAKDRRSGDVQISSYFWTVFSPKKLQTSDYILCNGYIRRFTETMQYIPIDIVNLCAIYFGSVLCLDSILATDAIYSPIFMMDTFKWIIHLGIWRNEITLSLILLALPRNIRVCTKWTAICIQTNEIYSEYTEFSNKHYQNHHWHSKFPLRELNAASIKTLKELQFKVNILVTDILQINDESTNCIQHLQKQNISKTCLNTSLNILSDYYQFQCLSQRLNERIQVRPNIWLFKMFGIKWKISIDYNSLEMIALVNQCQSAYFSIKYQFVCHELDWKVEGILMCNEYTKITLKTSDNSHSNQVSVSYYDINKQKIQNDINCRFYLTMKLIDIYSKDNINLMHEYKCNKIIEQKKDIEPVLVKQFEWTLSANDENCKDLPLFKISQEPKTNHIASKGFIIRPYRAPKSHTRIVIEANVERVGPFKFFIEGELDPNENKNVFTINLLSLSPNISKVLCLVEITIEMNELTQTKEDRSSCFTMDFTHTKQMEWFRLSFNRQVLKKAEQQIIAILYKIKISVLDVLILDNNGHFWSDYKQSLTIQPKQSSNDILRWTLNPEFVFKTKIQSYKQNLFCMHGFEWKLTILDSKNITPDMNRGEFGTIGKNQKDDKTFFVDLELSLPKHVSSVWFKYKLECKEVSIINTAQMEFTHGNAAKCIRFARVSTGCCNWGRISYVTKSSILSKSETTKEMTLILSITLYDVYDENGYPISEKYIK